MKTATARAGERGALLVSALCLADETAADGATRAYVAAILRVQREYAREYRATNNENLRIR